MTKARPQASSHRGSPSRKPGFPGKGKGTKAGHRKPGAPGKQHEKKGKPRAPEGLGRPLVFREAFDQLWTRLFTTPAHLDSLLAKAPPSVKSSLAPLSRLLLQRPRSLARYLRFQLDSREPWQLHGDELAQWPTARAMAHRLLQSFERDNEFFLDGHAVEDDFPVWMVEEWKREFGKQVAAELVSTLGSPPPLALRASRARGRNEVLSAVNDSRALVFRGFASKVAPLGFVFPDYVPILSLPLFRDGAYEIQDEGSQLMALFALWPRDFLPMLRKLPGSCREWPHEKEIPEAKKPLIVIDACAGAGGKTLAMADALRGKGQVFAYDVAAPKLEALRKRAKRVGLNSIKTVALPEGREAEAIAKFHGRADVVLVDAPCSGWGVLRRNPDLKWRQDRESRVRLAKLQAHLLDLYCPLVKKGGTLTFGVCTFRKDETMGQVEGFLERHPEFVSIGGGYLGPGPSDGFFLHAFERKIGP